MTTALAARRSRIRRTRWALGLAALVAFGGSVVWAVGFSDLLAVRQVSVTGLEGDTVLSPAEVEEAAQVPIGRPLARLEPDLIAERVSALPAVRAVEVSRAWPRSVSIAVTERDAVAVLVGHQDAPGSGVAAGADRAGGQLVDIDGFAFGSARELGELAGDLVELRVGAPRRESIAAGARVAAALSPGIARRVELIAVESLDSVTLRMTDGVSVRWGSAEDSRRKVEVLETLLENDAGVYDVSVPDRPAISE